MRKTVDKEGGLFPITYILRGRESLHYPIGW